MSGESHGNGHILNREEYAERMVERLAAEDDINVLERADLDLTLRIGETEMRLSLQTFYDAYIAAPGELEAVAERVVEAVRSFKVNRKITQFDALRERVFPMLKPIRMLLAVSERGLPMLAYRIFLADLIIAYVIDEPSSVAYINEEHLERWEIGEQILHDQAIANLRRRTLGQVRYTAVGEGAQRLFIFSSQDGYDAARILLPEVLEQWRVQLPGRMAIGIPNRDFLIAFSDVDRTVLSNIARQIEIDAGQRAYGLTDRLFTFGGSEVREYVWE